jgi:tetratricopeptide (TPR) repeat protein
LAALNQVVAAAPEYAEGWNTRATLLYLMGDYVASAVDVKRTLALEPRHFGAWSGLGLIYLNVGDERAALVAFSKALEWNPHLSGSRHKLEAVKKQLREHAI